MSEHIVKVICPICTTVFSIDLEQPFDGNKCESCTKEEKMNIAPAIEKGNRELNPACPVAMLADEVKKLRKLLHNHLIYHDGRYFKIKEGGGNAKGLGNEDVLVVPCKEVLPERENT
jgi:hypothetical protein